MTIMTCTTNVFNIGQGEHTSLVIIAYLGYISVLSIDGTEYTLEEVNL